VARAGGDFVGQDLDKVLLKDVGDLADLARVLRSGHLHLVLLVLKEVGSCRSGVLAEATNSLDAGLGLFISIFILKVVVPGVEGHF